MPTMNTQDAIKVLQDLNKFRDNPTAFPPRFPEPKQFKEAVATIAEYIDHSVTLDWMAVRDLAVTIIEVEDEFETKVQTNPELCEEVLKRFNERRK